MVDRVALIKILQNVKSSKLQGEGLSVQQDTSILSPLSVDLCAGKVAGKRAFILTDSDVNNSRLSGNANASLALPRDACTSGTMRSVRPSSG